MKKIISLVLACILVLSVLPMTAYAAEDDTREPSDIMPRYTYLSNCWVGLNPAGNGYYKVTGGAGSAVGSVTIAVTVILQRYNPNASNGWDNVYTWSDTDNYNAAAGGTYHISTPGTYRTHLIVNVYTEDGRLGEKVTNDSNQIVISQQS